MPRPPRLQYPGAIYHLVTRGDGRRTLFHDDGRYADRGHPVRVSDEKAEPGHPSSNCGNSSFTVGGNGGIVPGQTKASG